MGNPFCRWPGVLWDAVGAHNCGGESATDVPFETETELEQELEVPTRTLNRNVEGKFTGAIGGINYGQLEEAEGMARYDALFDTTAITTKVRATFAGGEEGQRYYGGLALKPDGTYEGV